MQGMFVEDYKCLECLNYIIKLLTKFIGSEFLDYYSFECLRVKCIFRDKILKEGYISLIMNIFRSKFAKDLLIYNINLSNNFFHKYCTFMLSRLNDNLQTHYLS